MFILWWLQVRCQVYSLFVELRHSSVLAHVQGELCIDYSRWLLYRYNDVANIITCICFHLRRFSEFRRIGTVSGSSQDCSAPVVRLLLVFSLAVLARAIQLGGDLKFSVPFFPERRALQHSRSVHFGRAKCVNNCVIHGWLLLFRNKVNRFSQ